MAFIDSNQTPADWGPVVVEANTKALISKLNSSQVHCTRLLGTNLDQLLTIYQGVHITYFNVTIFSSIQYCSKSEYWPLK